MWSVGIGIYLFRREGLDIEHEDFEGQTAFEFRAMMYGSGITISMNVVTLLKQKNEEYQHLMVMGTYKSDQLYFVICLGPHFFLIFLSPIFDRNSLNDESGSD